MLAFLVALARRQPCSEAGWHHLIFYLEHVPWAGPGKRKRKKAFTVNYGKIHFPTDPGAWPQRKIPFWLAPGKYLHVNFASEIFLFSLSPLETPASKAKSSEPERSILGFIMNI